MRTSVKIGAAFAGAALLAAAAAAPASAKSPWTKTGASIVGTAVAASGGIGAFDDNSDDYDLLIAALVGTGLVAAFDGTEYTVFAPNDGAFIDAADALTPSISITTEAQAVEFFTGVLSTDAGKAFVSDVLLTHVVAGTRPAASVVKGQVLTTLNGQKLQFSGGSLNVLGEGGNSAGIITANLKTTDGAIHVIDAVLLPAAS